MKNFIYLFFIAPLFLMADPVLAQTATNSGRVILDPVIIEEKTTADDIFDYEIKLKNETGRNVVLYPIVWDVASPSADASSSNSEYSPRILSLASWVTLGRGMVELTPGEERIEKMNVNIANKAIPGVYLAEVFFSAGANRWDAEGAARNSIQPKISLRYEITEKVIEQAELSAFKPDKEVFLHSLAQISFSVHNAGSETIEPAGSIRFYNRQGEEVDLAEIKGKTIDPGNTEKYDIDWQPKKPIGRYKAKLILEYGRVSRRDLQDTCFFWVVPKTWLILLMAGLGLAFVLLMTASIMGKRKAAMARKIMAIKRKNARLQAQSAQTVQSERTQTSIDSK